MENTDRGRKKYVFRERNLSPFKCVISIGESVMVDSLNYYIYHIDDEGSWVKYPQLHPNFTSSCNPDEET